MNSIVDRRKNANTDNVLSKFARQFRKLFRYLLQRTQSLARAPVIPIDEALWQRATAPYIFVHRLTLEENRRLRLVASDFMARKNIAGAGGFVITDLVRVQIAAQACILILELGVDSYEGWTDIVVYPATFRPRREFTDAAGVVHTTTAALAGEAWLGGPVVLSYDAVSKSGGMAEHNVVIHEFAHKLDMRNGPANGFPPLHRGMRSATWRQVFMAAYLNFCERTDNADALARTDGGAALDLLPLDPYASETPAEFFAVVSESFFEAPDIVAAAYPKVYEQLVAFYKQDPAR